MRRFLTFILAILGMIIGLIVGPSFKTIPFLSWLALGGEFGLENPLILDLNFIKLTFGIWCKVNIAGVLFAMLFALIGYQLLRKMRI